MGGDYIRLVRKFKLQIPAQTVHTSADLAPELMRQWCENESLYEILKFKYGLCPVRARETHFADRSDEDQAGLLRVEAGSPTLVSKRVSHLRDGRPLEYACWIMRRDRYRIVLELVTDQRGRKESHGWQTLSTTDGDNK